MKSSSASNKQLQIDNILKRIEEIKEIPQYFICSSTNKLMENPVISKEDGISYERPSSSNAGITDIELLPNYSLRSSILHYREDTINECLKIFDNLVQLNKKCYAPQKSIQI